MNGLVLRSRFRQDYEALASPYGCLSHAIENETFRVLARLWRVFENSGKPGLGLVELFGLTLSFML